MDSAATNLWTWIETNMLSSKTSWSNTASYDPTVDEPVMDEMVDGVFGGYRRFIRFTVGVTRYRLEVPLQNKHTRGKKAYGTYHGGENMVNVVAWPDAGGANVFNLHIKVRRACYIKKKPVVDDDGWSTVCCL